MSTIFILTGCSILNQEDTSVKNEEAINPVSKSELNIEVIGENLNTPWSINKQGQTFYISERPGTIVKIENGEVIRQQVQLKKQLSLGIVPSKFNRNIFPPSEFLSWAMDDCNASPVVA